VLLTAIHENADGVIASVDLETGTFAEEEKNGSKA